MPPVPVVASGFGGGQLIWLALTVLVRAAARGQAAAGCVCRWTMKAGPPEAMLWEHPGLHIGLSHGQGSNSG
jgi:hypothetical protein